MNARIVGAVVLPKAAPVVKRVYVQRSLKVRLAPILMAAFRIKYKKDQDK